MGDKKTYTLLATTGGVDYASALNRLPDLYAQELVNIYPDDGVCKLRLGCEARTYTETETPVKTLDQIIKADGTVIPVYVSDNDIYKYNLTTETSTSIGSCTEDAIQVAQFGYRIFGVNGADTPWVWDGSAASTSSAGFSGSGLTATNLINISTYRERLYFVEKNTGNIWYTSTVKTITGALTKFDADYVLRKGGFVVSCGGYTNSHGANIESLFYILSSQGELIFYTGNSPAAQDWQIVARFDIGKPLGYRAHLQAGNDLYFITDRGLESCNELFSGITVLSQNTIGRNINKLIRFHARNYPFSYLWQIKYWSGGGRIYLSLPYESYFNKLLVLNLNTRAWTVYRYNTTTVNTVPASASLNSCKWTSIANIGSEIWAGSFSETDYSAMLAELETGFSDNGAVIKWEIFYGYQYFQSQQLKRFTEIRPLVKTAPGVSMSFGLHTDYKDDEQVDPSSIVFAGDSGVYTPWGSDWGSEWSTEIRTKYDRYALSGSGHSLGLKVFSSTKDAPIDFYAFEISYEDGVRR